MFTGYIHESHYFLLPVLHKKKKKITTIWDYPIMLYISKYIFSVKQRNSTVKKLNKRYAWFLKMNVLPIFFHHDKNELSAL